MATRPETKWNRDDRDLLVELRTQMTGMFSEISAARAEIKEINTGITARLLNLESNSLSRIEVNPRLDVFDERITDLEDSRIAFRASIQVWLLLGGAIWTIVTLLLSIWLSTKF